MSVIIVHRRQAEESLDCAHHVYGGVEGVVDKGLVVFLARGVLADDEGDAAVGIDMIVSILRIVFEDHDGGIVPVWTVGDGLHNASESKIIVRDGRAGRSLHRSLS